MCKNYNKQPPNNSEQPSIFSNWKDNWGKTINSSQKDFYSLFFNYFENSYNFADKEIVKHKKWNFKVKLCYLFILLLLVITQIGFFAFNIWVYRENIRLEYVAAISAQMLLIIILVTVTFSKLLDIKKFQETYSRHFRFQHRRNTEMIKYLLNLDDYENKETNIKDKIFMKNIIDIEQENINKFCDNLDQKERNIREGLELFVSNTNTKKNVSSS